ncbi:MAG TPA: aldose 1-epimerase [Solirubrobacteraceae bacterium]|nr:aldose 1-epimerase [Solirubrobacteraceae bacterium]
MTPEPMLDIVTLRDERSSLRAGFVPAAGMLCCSLRDGDEELLAQNAGVAAYAEQGKTMGIPLLYPWANRLAGFEYSAAGRTVRVPRDPSLVAVDGNGLPIHGVIGGRMRWELSDEPAGEADRRSPDKRQQLQARLGWSRAQASLFDVFPFHHEACFRARLHERRLQIEVTVEACGEDHVPVAFGFHPYLSVPGVPRERWLVQLPAMSKLALDARQLPTGSGQALPAESFELAEREYDDGFDELSQSARFAVTGGERRLELDFEEGYRCGQVYSPRGAEFICFEPMTAPANALCSHQGLRVLSPGERYRAAFALRVSERSGPDGAH